MLSLTFYLDLQFGNEFFLFPGVAVVDVIQFQQISRRTQLLGVDFTKQPLRIRWCGAIASGVNQAGIFPAGK